MAEKRQLTPRERIKAAYLHLVLGVEQQAVAAAFEVNLGRVSEAVTALELAAGDPKGVRAAVEGKPDLWPEVGPREADLLVVPGGRK